jgi:hypothetical protein
MSLAWLRSLMGPRLPLPRDVLVCRECGGDWVNPTAWDEAPAGWLVSLRCGACGDERTQVLTKAEAKRFNQSLDLGFAEISKAADALAGERMRSWVETFASALERDLIGVDDFAARR